MVAELWPLGVAIYITGTIGESLGANLQRLSVCREQRRKEEAEGSDLPYTAVPKRHQRLWMAGFLMFVFAGIGMSAALFFASQTMLAPLQLFLFLFNAIFANVINKEVFHWLGLDGLATLLVMVGVVMAVIAAPKVNHEYSDDEMLQLMITPGFISFVVFVASFIFALHFSKIKILNNCNHDPTTIQHSYLKTLLNMSYGALAGAFGGLNVTLTKTVFSLIVGQVENEGIIGLFTSPLLYCVAFFLVLTYILQIVVTVSGLEVTSAIIVISAHAVTEEVVATLGGILYFQDYVHFTTWSTIVFVLGTLLAIAAVILLSHLRLQYIDHPSTTHSHAPQTPSSIINNHSIMNAKQKSISSQIITDHSIILQIDKKHHHPTMRSRTSSADSNYSYTSLPRRPASPVRMQSIIGGSFQHSSSSHSSSQPTPQTQPQNDTSSSTSSLMDTSSSSSNGHMTRQRSTSKDIQQQNNTTTTTNTINTKQDDALSSSQEQDIP
mmetsp:Transcript_30714/g.46484  ORF Transcript_30714/g.46484 Transcript_30714/m.46484 type:complete len:494 (+) Transcript_30714:449-1930(+)